MVMSLHYGVLYAGIKGSVRNNTSVINKVFPLIVYDLIISLVVFR